MSTNTRDLTRNERGAGGMMMTEPASNAHPQDRIAYVLHQKQVAFGRESEVAAAVVAYLGLVDM